MKKLLFIIYAVAFSFGLVACETENTRKEASDAAEAIEADIKESADSLEVNTEQAIETTKEVTKDIAGEIKEGAQKVEKKMEDKTEETNN